jgi:HAE1 family hydrophobic/amphiphilic exporter-1
VGLVVDDAIVVLENIVRHIEMGKRPLEARWSARRKWASPSSRFPSLVAVFIPIFFMPGVIGLMFHEFAVVVALSVLVSAAVSLMLVPMLASRLLPADAIDPEHDKGNFIGRWFEAGFGARATSTPHAGRGAAHRTIVLLAALGTFALTAVLYITIPKGFFPEEDLGQIRVNTEASEDISSAALMDLQEKVAAVIKADPNVQDVTSFVGGNTGRMFLVLKPRDQREKMPQVLDSLRKATKQVPGIAVYLSPVQNLQLGGRQSKSRYQYTLQSVSPALERVGRQIHGAHARRPGLPRRHQRFAEQGPASLAQDRPRQGQQPRRGDRRYPHRAVSGVWRAPGVDHLLAGRQLLRDPGSGRCRPPVRQRADRISVRNKTGQLVQLSSFATVERTIGPTAVNHQGQLQAITLSFNLAPDVPLGVATAKIDQWAWTCTCRHPSSPTTAAMRRCSRARRAAS